MVRNMSSDKSKCFRAHCMSADEAQADWKYFYSLDEADEWARNAIKAEYGQIDIQESVDKEWVLRQTHRANR